MLTKLRRFFQRTKYYYIGYIVHVGNRNIYGSGTFLVKKRPDLQKIIQKIHEYNGSKTKDIVIISCIECNSDFIGVDND